MNKIKSSFAVVTPATFNWVRDSDFPEFTPPDGDALVGRPPEHPERRMGELRSLLENFLETIIGTLNATAGVVRLLTPDGQTLQIISSAGLSAELQKEAENFMELECEVSDNLTFGHEVHASDISSCNSRHTCCYASCRFQSLIAAPLVMSNTDGDLLGILTIFFDVKREASTLSMNTVAAFAGVMSATIVHTRANRELSRLERMTARQEIANDIHDSLSQSMTYARMRISLLNEAIHSQNQQAAIKFARDVDDALEISQKSARELITDFRCEMHPGGLLPALDDLTSQFRERNAISLEYHNRLVNMELPLEHEIQVIHVVREALVNIARHSGATKSRLFVDANLGYYVITIEDNGSGASTFTPVEGHYGMLIMRERAQRINGEIKINSATGIGTQVQLFFPQPSLDWRDKNG